MHHTFLLALATGSLAVCSLTTGMLAAAEGPTITCKPVMMTSCAELPASIDFQNRPMGYELGFKIVYLVEGEDLIGFKKDSLTIAAITTADGKNIAAKRNGKPSWKQGSFPKTTDDGKFGIFEIEVSEVVFGKADGISVNGTITALSGSDRQTKKATLTVGEAKVEDLGGLKISLVGAGAEKEEKKSFFGGSFGVQVDGDINKVAEVNLFDGTTKVDSQGSSWSDTRKTYNFTKPAGKSLTVEISYWNKLATVVVPIGKK
jgi:hypothetical protein